QGDYEEAEPLYRRSLAIDGKVCGPDHPEVSQGLTTGRGCLEGRYDEAGPLYDRSLAIREKALGPNHPAVASSLNNRAGLLR
ncbi:unnamed protein product, partial [Hapterophycus canaliculatus]